MEKNNNLVKQHLLALVLLFTVTIYSCKKEIHSGELINSEILKENAAFKKKGFQITTVSFNGFKSKVNQSALGILQKQFGFSNAPKRIMSIALAETYKGFALITDSIKMIKDGNTKSYVFPVKLNSPMSVMFQNLTIVESPQGTSAFVTSYTPTIKWINNWKAGKQTKFDGEVVVTPIDLGNGYVPIPATQQLSSLLKNQKSGSLTPLDKSSLAAPGCTEYTFIYSEAYKCGSGNHWPGDANCTLTGEGAAGYANISSTMTICTGEGSGGGGGTTTPTPDPNYNPCPGTPPTIEFRGLRGERLAVAAGTTPCDLQPLPPASVINIIRNEVKNACIKNALNQALSKNAVNEIKTLFYDSFGSNKNYNVVFADGSLNNYSLDARARTEPDANGIMTSTITFNSDIAGIRSEQYAVATVYHEMVHAELRKLFPQDPQGKVLVPSQHEYMAQNFVDKIMASLKSVFPNLSDTDAWALSWGGLKQTSFFDLLSDANKTMIGETLMKYSDKDRYDKLGTYCNN